MGERGTWSVLLSLGACLASCALPDGHPSAPAPPQPYGSPAPYYYQPYGYVVPGVDGVHPPTAYGAGVAITATAPLGMSVAMLGAPLDENFHALRGLGAALPVFSGGALPLTPVKQYESAFYKAEQQLELGASISGWFAGGGASSDLSTRYVSARASYVDYAIELNERSVPNPAPDGAAWYIGKIYFGSTYEVVLFERDTSLTAHAAADFFAWRGDMHAYAASRRFQDRVIVHGLNPRGTQVFMAHTPAEVAQNFQLTQEAFVPILIEYRSMPNVTPKDASIPWRP